MPKVSICIPVYNRADILCRAIDSCLRQTYKDIEVVVCDNASTDNTKEVVLQYCKKDSRVKLYQNDVNIGGLKNFKKTIEHAKGEFCILLGSDDWISDDFIKERIRGFEVYPKAAFVSGPMATNTLYGDGSIKKDFEYKYRERKLTKDHVYNNFYKNYLASYFCMFRTKDILEAYQFDYPNPYDWEIYSKGYGLDLINCLKILDKYDGIYYVNKGIYNFANHLSRESEDILPEEMRNSSKILRTLDDFTYQTYMFNDFLKLNSSDSTAKRYRRFKLLQLYYEILRTKGNVQPINKFFDKFNKFKKILEIKNSDIINASIQLPCYFVYRLLSFTLRNIFKKEIL